VQGVRVVFWRGPLIFRRFGVAAPANEKRPDEAANDVAQMPPERASPDQINDYFYGQGWTDGLPIVPPRRERVDKMLAAVRQAPETVIGVIPPRMEDPSGGV